MATPKMSSGLPVTLAGAPVVGCSSRPNRSIALPAAAVASAPSSTSAWSSRSTRTSLPGEPQRTQQLEIRIGRPLGHDDAHAERVGVFPDRPRDAVALGPHPHRLEVA